MAYPAFRFGSFMVRVASCGDTTLDILSPPPVCVPPTCGYWTVCDPKRITMARVRFDPKSDPRDLRRLLEQIEGLNLEAQILVKESPDEPGAVTAALRKALEGP